MPSSSRRQRGEHDDWARLRTGPRAHTGPGAPPPLRLAPLPAPRFVRPTVLTANYDACDGDDTFQAALYVAPDGGPARYEPPLQERRRRLRETLAAVTAEREAARRQPQRKGVSISIDLVDSSSGDEADDPDAVVLVPPARKPINAEDPILISDDDDDMLDAEQDFSVVAVKRLSRPGIGASPRTALGTNSMLKQRKKKKKKKNKKGKKKLNAAGQQEQHQGAGGGGAVGGNDKGKAKAHDIVVISDDDDDDEEEDEDVGTLSMAQTYAALLECIGGSTSQSNPTALPGQSVAAKQEIKQETGALIRQSESSRAHSCHSSGNALPVKSEKAEAPASTSSRLLLPAPPSPPSSSRAAQLPPRPSNPHPGLPPRPPPALASTITSPTLPREDPDSATPSRIRALRQSRWPGFEPCSECDMFIPINSTLEQRNAHRASMPHRLALALPLRVEHLRRAAEVKRQRVRDLISSLNRGEDAARAQQEQEAQGQGQAQSHSPSRSHARQSPRQQERRRQDELLALTRQSNRGFGLLEKYGWEAGVGIGWQEWRRHRRTKRIAREQAALKREQERLAKEARVKVEEGDEGALGRGGSGGGGGGGENAGGDADQNRGGGVDAAQAVAGDEGEAAAAAIADGMALMAVRAESPVADASMAAEKSKESSSAAARKQRRRERRRTERERRARYRAGGETLDSAIALSDSDDENAHADVSGQSSHGFLDFRFDSSDDSRSIVDMDEDTSFETDDDDDEGTDIEWLGVETKRKKGEGVHAWLLRKFNTTEHAKRVEAGKKRKRGQAEADDGDGWEDDDDDDGLDDEGADADEEADFIHGDGQAGPAPGVENNGVPVPARRHVSRLEPLAVSIRMQLALDRSGVGASSAYRPHANRLARAGGTIDVLAERQHRARRGAPIPRRYTYTQPS